MRLSTRFLKSLGDFFFPEFCFGCNKRGFIVCRTCIEQARPADGGLPDAPLDYRHHGIQKALWSLKYKKYASVAEPFGHVLHEHLLPLVSEVWELSPGRTAPILIIPMPIHSERRRERGYNQTELIARKIEEFNPRVFKVLDGVLIKTRATKPQATCTTLKERLLNLKGSFDLINPKLLQGEVVILLDDVITTGNTMDEASKVLQRAKPEVLHRVALTRPYGTVNS